MRQESEQMAGWHTHSKWRVYRILLLNKGCRYRLLIGLGSKSRIGCHLSECVHCLSGATLATNCSFPDEKKPSAGSKKSIMKTSSSFPHATRSSRFAVRLHSLPAMTKSITCLIPNPPYYSRQFSKVPP